MAHIHPAGCIGDTRNTVAQVNATMPLSGIMPAADSVVATSVADIIIIKFPGYLSPSAGLKFADVPNGLAAISKVPAAGWGQILAYMAFCEVSQDQSPGTPAAAGDFGFKVLTASDPAEKTKKLSAELANGRLAMTRAKSDLHLIVVLG